MSRSRLYLLASTVNPRRARFDFRRNANPKRTLRDHRPRFTTKGNHKALYIAEHAAHFEHWRATGEITYGGEYVLANLRAKGEEYHRNGHTLKIGHYALDSLDKDGTLTAGCHVIAWAEVERLAKSEGWA